MFIDNIYIYIYIWDQLAVHVCKHTYKTRTDDDRHTCACLFIVVVHQLKRFLLTLSLL
jgi:hypothetical protein